LPKQKGQTAVSDKSSGFDIRAISKNQFPMVPWGMYVIVQITKKNFIIQKNTYLQNKK
jgi:hypothetical protein